MKRGFRIYGLLFAIAISLFAGFAPSSANSLTISFWPWFFLDNRANDPIFGNSGVRLLIGATVSHSSGVPEHIERVFAVHTTSKNVYELEYNSVETTPGGTSGYYQLSMPVTHFPQSDRVGYYQITAISKSGETASTFYDPEIDVGMYETVPLSIPTDISITGGPLAPAVSWGSVEGATHYQFKVFDEDTLTLAYDSPLVEATLGSTVRMSVPEGILKPNVDYVFSPRGLHIDFLLQRRAVNFKQVNFGSRTHGLFIGVNDEAGFEGIEAATALARMFRRHFDAETEVLGIHYGVSTARDMIATRIERIFERAQEGDKVFVYIATHGGPDFWGRGNETTSTRRDESLFFQNIPWSDRAVLSDNFLTQALTPYADIDKFIMLDACNSGGFWGNHNPRDLGDLEKTGNSGLLASAAEDGLAYFNEEGVPLISYALLRGFEVENGYLKMDRDQDGQVSYDEMTAWVKLEQHRVEYIGEVVFELGFGDPAIFSEEMWNPVEFSNEGLNWQTGVGNERAGPLAIVTIRSESDDTTLRCVENRAATIVLDANGSTHVNGLPLFFRWNGPFGEMAGESIEAELPIGEHTITLTARDEFGLEDSTTLDIVVEGCGLECDINLDGTVSGQDVGEFVRGCELGVAPWRCDLDGNGKFDGRDVRLFQRKCRVEK